jgi:hypothetical protein
VAKRSFEDEDINARITAGVRRLHARQLNRLLEPPDGDIGKEYAELLADALDVYAKGYLEAVDTKEQVSEYVGHLWKIAAKLIENNFEQTPFLLDPPSVRFYSEAQNREWRARRRAKLRNRIEILLEARIRHWEAEAIERALSSAKQDTPESSGEPRPRNWDELEIRFLSDHRIQYSIAGKAKTLNYGDIGFVDNRTGNPNLSWKMLLNFAQGGGIWPVPVRNSSEFERQTKIVQRLGAALKKYFGLSTNPISKDTAHNYRCAFKIGCAPSFER